MTCYLDWRMEPGMDVSEEIEIKAKILARKGKEYTITCWHGICGWREKTRTPSSAITEKNAHAAWHDEGCPE